MINYIVGKDIEFKGIARVFNLKRGKEVVEHDNVLYLNNEPICYLASQNSKDFFARNDDENGLQRFDLAHAIENRLMVLRLAYDLDKAEIIKSFNEETTEEEKINALSNLEDYLDSAYKKIKIVIPNGLNEGNVLNYRFFNAEIDKLETLLNIVNNIRADFTQEMYEEYISRV